MNFNLLNKKWTSYFNWSFLYPSYFFLFIMSIFMVLFSIGYLENFKLELLFSMFFIFVFAFIGFGILVIIYVIAFIILSDGLFKILGYNRLLANLINILLSFLCLGFITFIFLWIKVKNIYEENNIECYWSGKLK